MKKRIIAMITVITLLVPVAPLGTIEKTSQAASKTIAALNYSYSGSADIETSTDASDLTLNKTKYGSKKNGYNFTSGSAKLYASINGSDLRKLEWSDSNYKSASGNKEKVPVMTAGKKNPWKSGTTPYFEVVVSTKGYKSINFSAYVGASKKGPKNYNIAYAVGSSTSFKTISGSSLALSDNKQMEKISASLPSGAENKASVKIRIQVSSLVAINGNSLTATGNTTKGEVAINNISLVAGSTVSTSSTSKTSSSSTKITFKKGKKTIKKLTIKKKKTAKITILTKPSSAKVKLCKLTKKAKKLLKVKLKKKKLTIKAKKKGSTYIKVKVGKVTKKLKIKIK